MIVLDIELLPIFLKIILWNFIGNLRTFIILGLLAFPLSVFFFHFIKFKVIGEGKFRIFGGALTRHMIISGSFIIRINKGVCEGDSIFFGDRITRMIIIGLNNAILLSMLGLVFVCLSLSPSIVIEYDLFNKSCELIKIRP